MPVTRRTLKLEEDLRRDLLAVTDQQEQSLVSAWADAWDEISPDLTAVLLEMLTAGDKVTRAQLLRSTRLRKVLVLIAAQLQALATKAGVTITGDLAAVIETAGAAQASVIDSQLPAGSGLLDGLDGWSRVDARQVEAIVRRSTEQITSRTREIPDATYQVVRRELIRGVAAGTNPKQTAARIVRRAEKGFNGKEGLTRALNIARTETLDAHRAAAELSQNESADVLAGWDWLAKLDTLTCPSCIAQHGTTHPLDEPGPLDHQQGRCARMPRTKTWAELGIDLEEPASVMPDADAWFEELSSEEQLEILRPARYAAWTRGDYPISAWSARQSTDGWRDSYRVSRVPGQSGGRVSRSAA